MQVPEYSLFAASCWCWLCFFSFFVSVPFAGSSCVRVRVRGTLVEASRQARSCKKGHRRCVFFFPPKSWRHCLLAWPVLLAHSRCVQPQPHSSPPSVCVLAHSRLVRCAALSRQFSTASPSPTPRRRDGRKLQIKCVCVGPGPSTTTRNLLAPATSAEYAVRVLLRYA